MISIFRHATCGNKIISIRCDIHRHYEVQLDLERWVNRECCGLSLRVTLLIHLHSILGLVVKQAISHNLRFDRERNVISV